jgi:hypothetical protein
LEKPVRIRVSARVEMMVMESFILLRSFWCFNESRVLVTAVGVELVVSDVFDGRVVEVIAEGVC